MHIIYCHGFSSSAQSVKAQIVKKYVEKHPQYALFLVDLPYSPGEAMALLESHIATLKGQNWGVIGSSLGGYYATYLAEKYHKKAVVINPAVKAYEHLEARVGENKIYYADQTFEFTQAHLQQLKDIYFEKLTQPSDILLLTKKGDEVLDYQQGVKYYCGAKQLVIEGGNHGFDDYDDYLAITFKHLLGQ